MNYFKDSEFDCKCGQCDKGFKDIHPIALQMLNYARGIAGIPFIITSAIRCEYWNDIQGGSSTSSHLEGWAFDILAETSRDRFLIIQGLLGAGFTRIGIGKGFVHVDCDPGKAVKVMWRY